MNIIKMFSCCRKPDRPSIKTRLLTRDEESQTETTLPISNLEPKEAVWKTYQPYEGGAGSYPKPPEKDIKLALEHDLEKLSKHYKR